MASLSMLRYLRFCSLLGPELRVALEPCKVLGVTCAIEGFPSGESGQAQSEWRRLLGLAVGGASAALLASLNASAECEKVPDADSDWLPFSPNSSRPSNIHHPSQEPIVPQNILSSNRLSNSGLGSPIHTTQFPSVPTSDSCNSPINATQLPVVPTSDSCDEVTHARSGLAKRLTNLNPVPTKTIPWPIISKKGQQVSVRFKLAPSTDFSHFVTDAISRLGCDPQEGAPSSGPLVKVQAYDSPVARHILILPPQQTPSKYSNPQSSQELTATAGDNLDIQHNIDSQPASDKQSAAASNEAPASDSHVPSSNQVSIVIFQSLVGERTTEVEYIRKGHFSEAELDAIASGIKIGIGNLKEEAPKKEQRSTDLEDREKRRSRGRVAASLSKLESMGVIVYGAETVTETDEGGAFTQAQKGTWGHLAGYEEQKKEIEDTVLLALQKPEVYERIARGTRREFESNRPRAILFDGPPGTGKTSCARLIAGRAGVPLLYVPLEAVASKYYGESERLLAAVFTAGKDFPHGCLVFLDEIDALATERDSNMHEATRRVLSVLLRQLDGFEPDRKTIVIAATNRKEDLDAALLSRFDTTLTFGLPDFRTRQAIFAEYAQHLSSAEREPVAAATEGMSGRDIRDICEQAERHWASMIIRDQAPRELPTVDEYLRCCRSRKQGLSRADQAKDRTSVRSPLGQQFA